MITVAIIDDNRLVREALAAMLNQLPDMQVVAEAVTDDGIPWDNAPQVVLLDAGLGDEDSARVAAEVKTRAPDTKIIVMDVMPLSEDIVELVNAGVSGFVLKEASLEEFVETIRSVAAGGKVLPSRMTESLFAQIARMALERNEGGGESGGAEPTFEHVRMTRREREVIDLIGEGLSNKEIAQRLNIAAHTVKSHVRNVMEKLALHTRLQIAAYSRRRGA
jgi:DNA-binding NarL/FixJ family response regulator